MSNLFESDIYKVLGFYDFGDHSNIIISNADNRISTEATYFHETTHQFIVTGTAFGFFQQCLNNRIQAGFHSDVRDLFHLTLEESLIAHEGFATFRELNFFSTAVQEFASIVSPYDAQNIAYQLAHRPEEYKTGYDLVNGLVSALSNEILNEKDELSRLIATIIFDSPILQSTRNLLFIDNEATKPVIRMFSPNKRLEELNIIVKTQEFRESYDEFTSTRGEPYRAKEPSERYPLYRDTKRFFKNYLPIDSVSLEEFTSQANRFVQGVGERLGQNSSTRFVEPEEAEAEVELITEIDLGNVQALPKISESYPLLNLLNETKDEDGYNYLHIGHIFDPKSDRSLISKKLPKEEIPILINFRRSEQEFITAANLDMLSKTIKSENSLLDSTIVVTALANHSLKRNRPLSTFLNVAAERVTLFTYLPSTSMSYISQFIDDLKVKTDAVELLHIWVKSYKSSFLFIHTHMGSHYFVPLSTTALTGIQKKYETEPNVGFISLPNELTSELLKRHLVCLHFQRFGY